MRRLVVVSLLLLSPPAALAGQALGADQEARVHEIFADLHRPGSPGASVAIVRDGEIAYSMGFGHAQIEHGVAVSPRTVFHVASVSKQFTAMAVLLLEADGLLSLDDDVRTHLPELPDLGARVTVRHLLTHTSGIRDQWELLAMAGWRLDDVITKEHVRRLMRNQRELNFPPGSEYLYSNMGYSVAADLVERVSGEPFSEFAQERIFRPLGMTSTHVHDDHEMVVPHRAYSYREDGDGGYRKAVLSYANHGATSLFTTAEDLARWLDNFRHASLGGRALLDRMTTRAVLTDGDTISYALGVSVGEYRGARTVGHGGSDAGFRSQVLWLPEQATGVVVLSNLASGNPGGRARSVAEVVLADALEPQQPDDDEDEEDEPDEEEPEPPVVVPSQYVGAYYSPELETLYEIRSDEDGLLAHQLRHGEFGLEPEETDVFDGGRWFFREVRFTRDGTGRVDGFRVSGGRVRNLRFVRVEGGLPGG